MPTHQQVTGGDPGPQSLKRVTPASKAVSEGFREEVTQKLPFKDAQDLNVSWGFREECCLGRGVEGRRQSCGGREWFAMSADDHIENGKGRSMTPS